MAAYKRWTAAVGVGATACWRRRWRTTSAHTCSRTSIAAVAAATRHLGRALAHILTHEAAAPEVGTAPEVAVADVASASPCRTTALPMAANRHVTRPVLLS
ncbi:hypothetical protein HYH02_004255 [Chlamydomonas schloesseri]|uniref:Uncharacterized protein n=1 Tax=Chlamydomonas schloesseri TaxID=2026947 RepID=A0A836B8V4_9CHLO|nr:hypothetical protein HYH02_004255 [Chlamydomonas schloesseri]|eukprot:KAG2450983.1 hypothetical protein HYH02_004255 [Chlamydomonas schloesseri]